MSANAEPTGVGVVRRAKQVIHIESFPYASVQHDVRRTLDRHAREAFADVDLVRSTQWSQPDWTYIARCGHAIVGHYNLVEREILLDGQPVRAVGLNNLVAAPGERGRGHGRRLLEQTQELWSSKHSAEVGLLLCSNELVRYYADLGWYRSAAEVEYDQPTGRCRWRANCMLYAPNESHEPARIDLRGLPW